MAVRTGRLHRATRLLQWLVYAGVVAWAGRFASTMVREQGLPEPGMLVLMLTATVGGTVAGGGAWALLVGSGPPHRLTAGFVTSQITKYLPGGLWQPAHQIAVACRHGVAFRDASFLFLVFMAMFVLAACGLAPLLALADLGLPTPLRALLMGLPSALVLLHPRFLRVLLRAVPRRWRMASGQLPPPRRVLGALLGQWTYLLGQGAVLLLGLHALTGEWLPAAVPAFAVAWAAGFLVVPLPAGAGVREAVLVGLLGAAVAPSVVVLAAVAQRLVALLGELLASVGLELYSRMASPVTAYGATTDASPPASAHSNDTEVT